MPQQTFYFIEGMILNQDRPSSQQAYYWRIPNHLINLMRQVSPGTLIEANTRYGPVNVVLNRFCFLTSADANPIIGPQIFSIQPPAVNDIQVTWLDQRRHNMRIADLQPVLRIIRPLWPYQIKR